MNNQQQVQKNFELLKKRIITEGLFVTSKWKVVSDLGLIFLTFALAIYLRDLFPFVALCLAAMAGVTTVWWIHDAGHDSFFSSKTSSRFSIEFMGLLILGMPQIEYHYDIHRRHHGATNIIGRDGALNTRPIFWHSRMFNAANNTILKGQGWIWFFLVLPLTWPILNIRCTQILIEKRRYFRLSALVLRWVAIPYLLNFDWSFILIPILLTAWILGFSASLNHFHMDMDTKPLASFPKSVFLTTQNLSNKSAFVTWLTGGLNFHIEHHLFPNLPSSKLGKVSRLVKEFADANSLPYQTDSIFKTTLKVFQQLQNPIIASHKLESQTILNVTKGVYSENY